MAGFDKQRVLERVTADAPILSNRQGEVEADGKKRKIYAYYHNRGVRDPDLQYDRVANPIATTPDATLCEVYSFWEGDPNVQKLLQRLVREGNIKEGDVLYQGPWVEHSLGDEGVIENARRGYGYSFSHSASAFEGHFNRICEELGYEPRLVDLFEENSGFFGSGAHIIQATRYVRLGVDGQATEGKILMRAPIGINLTTEDPTLSKTLDAIAQAYDRIVNPTLASAQIYLG